MGMVAVKFLGEEFQVSETIKEYLAYDKLLTPIRANILNTLSADIKKDAKLSWNAYTMTEHVHDTAEKYRQMVQDGAALLVEKLLELDVYDVTSDDILQKVTAIDDLNNLETLAFITLLEEGQKYVNMKTAGVEKAYNYSARNITGSGIQIFTNSFSTLIMHSIVEGSILLSQAKKADKEYEEAVKNISAATINALDILYRKVMVQEFYPSIAQVMLNFDSEVMSAFLVVLTTHEKFDFESVEEYDLLEAEEMLKNIFQVSDKIGFLKQVFLICPFSLEVYKACLNHDLLDKETFETARYFGFADVLVEEIDLIIKNNLNKIEKITPLISILAVHRGTDEIKIWNNIYESTLKNIENTYKTFNIALSDDRNLDKFIRNKINNSISNVVKKSRDDIIHSIDKMMLSTVSERQYDELVKMKLLFPETIRIPGSSAIDLNDINSEIRNALVDYIMEYIDEAKRRLDVYNKAMNKYETELKQKNDELSALQSKKSHLVWFAFSKKKKMTAIIKAKVNEISEFKNTNEPKELWTHFEAMYS